MGGRKQREREHQDDEATYRPKRHPVVDATVRPQDVRDDDSATLLGTIRQPVPRGPSPPIVYITPLRPNPSPAPSPSPVDAQEHDNATSESSVTSNSRRPGKRRYRVANPGDEEPATSYHYVPPPLPPTSQYSTHLGTSSKYNLDYIPDSNPPARSRSSSTPLSAPIPAPSSSSTGYPLYSHSSSKSSSSSASSLPQSSSGTEDSATWKRPPASAPLRRGRASSSSSSPKDEHENPSTGHPSAVQLRTPPPPTVPPPLPPARTPPPPSRPPPLPPSPHRYPSASRTEGRKLSMSHRGDNRPNADDVVRHLGEYFRGHDLDQPIVTPVASVDDLTDNSNPTPDEIDDNRESTPGPSSLNSSAAISSSPSRFSRLLVSNFNPSSSHRTDKRHTHNPESLHTSASASNSTTPFPRTSPSPGNVDVNNGKPTRAKTIRRIAEEQASKRMSNPGKARRQTLWDFKMEELKTPPPPVRF